MNGMIKALDNYSHDKKRRNLCFIATHILNQGIIDEYSKIERSGIDVLLLIDNRKNLIPGENCIFKVISLYDKRVNCYLSDENDLISLNLPRYCYNDRDASIDKTLWYNGDYSLYIIYHLLPNYDFYWRFEYDCFYNDKDYSTFFESYENNTADLIGHDIANPPAGWPHLKNIDWIYPEGASYLKNLFAVERLSNRAIRHLYATRLRHAQIFKNLKDKDARWPMSELICSTEICQNGMSWCNLTNAGRLTANKVIDLNSERLFIYPDKKLYHPIKPAAKV